MLTELKNLKDFYASEAMKPPVGWQRDNNSAVTRLSSDQKQQYLDYFRGEILRTIKQLEGNKRAPKVPPKFWNSTSKFYWSEM